MIGSRRKRKIISNKRPAGAGDFYAFADPMSFIVTLAIILTAIVLSVICIFTGMLARNDVAGNLLGNFGDIAT